MKNILIFLTVISAIIFCLSLFNLYEKSGFGLVVENTNLAGFDTSVDDQQSKNLREQFSTQLRTLKSKEENDKQNGLYINFLITVLTGITTLISSIKTAQASGETISKKVLITTAILSFCSTLASWGESKINDAKNDIQQKVQKVREIRNTFYNDYKNETDESKKQQMIKSYEEQLLDIL